MNIAGRSKPEVARLACDGEEQPGVVCMWRGRSEAYRYRSLIGRQAGIESTERRRIVPFAPALYPRDRPALT